MQHGKTACDKKEAAQLLSISVDTLDELRREQKVRCLYIGTRCYYSMDELKAFVLKIGKKN